MIRARKVLGVRGQYEGAAGNHPRLYPMLPTTLVPNGGPVDIPEDAHDVAASGHLVVVVGEPIERFTPRSRISRTQLAVTAGLSLCETTWYGQPLGPRLPSQLLATAIDSWAVLGEPLHIREPVDDHRLRTWHCGRIVADVRASAMRFPVLDLLAYLAEYMTLERGDVIFTGGVDTPPLRPGDHVAVEVEDLARAHATVATLSLDGLQLAGGAP